MPRIVTRPVIASIASVTRLSWRSVVGLRHWLKHATTSIMSGMGGCSWCRVGVGFPYSTQCSAALPHRHFGEGIVRRDLVVRDLTQIARNISGLLAPHEVFIRKLNVFRVIQGQPLVYWWDDTFLKRYA